MMKGLILEDYIQNRRFNNTWEGMVESNGQRNWSGIHRAADGADARESRRRGRGDGLQSQTGGYAQRGGDHI